MASTSAHPARTSAPADSDDESDANVPGSKRRAAIACNYCRKRKRRCDRKQPVCTLCQQSNNRPCEYQERDAGGKQAAQDGIHHRLERLESLVRESLGHIDPRQHGEAYAANSRDLAGSNGLLDHQQAGLNMASSRAYDNPSPLTGTLDTISPSVQTSSPANVDNNLHWGQSATMIIPLPHSTNTSSLLQAQPVRSLLGTYPPDLFFRIEARRDVPDGLDLGFCDSGPTVPPMVGIDEVRLLSGHYFDSVHPQHPILDKETAVVWLEGLLSRGLEPQPESALALVILSLGAAASEKPYPRSGGWLPGLRFFVPALRILLSHWPRSFTPSVVLPQALFLAAVYFNYVVRPLQAWRLSHMASTSAQSVWIQSRSSNQDVVRLCWAIFVTECDLLAEYHLPRSGIEYVVDRMPFPSCGSPAEPVMLRWLANLSSRRMLNRVHHIVYDQAAAVGVGDEADGSCTNQRGQLASTASTLQLSSEFRHQLSTWYDSIPASVKPDLDSDSPTDDEVILILRYHATGDIIFRPFLLHVCSLTSAAGVTQPVLENAVACLEHCIKFLRNVGYRTKSPSSSTEITLHSTLACAIIVALATLSPLLAPHVPDGKELIQIALSTLNDWAIPGSSIEVMHHIVLSLVDKCNMR